MSTQPKGNQTFFRRPLGRLVTILVSLTVISCAQSSDTPSRSPGADNHARAQAPLRRVFNPSGPNKPIARRDATCNGIDDDGDGRIDEDYVPRAINCGVGACNRTGKRVCIRGRLFNRCFPGSPSDEICDSIDNDCNGAVDDSLMCIEIADRPTLDEASMNDRWLGRLSGGNHNSVCPVPLGGSWIGTRLFQPIPRAACAGDDCPDLPDHDGTPFCLYIWTRTDRAPRDTDLVLLPYDRYDDRSPAEWLERDLHVVAPLVPFNDLANIARSALHTAFLAQAEKLGTFLQLESDTGATLPQSVRVALVDSSIELLDPSHVIVHDAGGRPGKGHLDHGRGMGELIEQLGCTVGSPGCGAGLRGSDRGIDIANHPALILTGFDTATGFDSRNGAEGGSYGSLADLAVQISDAVFSWELLGQTSPLIINLSLGWDGEYYESPSCSGVYGCTTRLTGVDLVREAIEHAVCKGALVIAAAGNRTDGSDPSQGPSYPAAWETESAAEVCKSRLGATDEEINAVLGEATYRPLVYAVGGVDGRDLALDNARPDGRPRLAAPGFQWAVPAHPGLMDTFTGSSVAAAVTTAAAAAIWRYRPDLGPSEVMEFVYDAGERLDGGDGTSEQADFCVGGAACDTIRRVSVCRAVRKAIFDGCTLPTPTIQAGADSCPASDSDAAYDCNRILAYTGSNATWDGAEALWTGTITGRGANGFVEADGSGIEQSVDGCNEQPIYTHDGFLPDRPCPTQQFYNGNLLPWRVSPFPGRVSPFPGKDGCEVCAVRVESSSGSLVAHLYISMTVEVMKLQDVSLHYGDGQRADLTSLLDDDDVPADGFVELKSGELYKMTDIKLDLSDIDDFKTAKLVYTVAGEPYSGSAPLLVLKD